MTQLIGYDLDGVVTEGLRPKPNDVIITGRSYQEAPETYVYLQKIGVCCPIYFQPVPFVDKTLEGSGKWKAKMCKKLGVALFHEDDSRQAALIKEVTEVHLVENFK